jgi:hypothetical protein
MPSAVCLAMFDCLWRRGGLKAAVRTGGVRMSGQVIIQYATLISLGVGILGLGIAVLIHRQQVAKAVQESMASKEARVTGR